MDRRDFLKAGLGATVVGAVGVSGTQAHGAPAAPDEGMRLNADAPIYQAGPDARLNFHRRRHAGSLGEGESHARGRRAHSRQIGARLQRRLCAGHVPRQFSPPHHAQGDVPVRRQTRFGPLDARRGCLQRVAEDSGALRRRQRSGARFGRRLPAPVGHGDAAAGRRGQRGRQPLRGTHPAGRRVRAGADGDGDRPACRRRAGAAGGERDRRRVGLPERPGQDHRRPDRAARLEAVRRSY